MTFRKDSLGGPAVEDELRRGVADDERTHAAALLWTSHPWDHSARGVTRTRVGRTSLDADSLRNAVRRTRKTARFPASTSYLHLNVNRIQNETE